MQHDPLSSNVPYDPPPDPFAWPQGAARGDDSANRARRARSDAPSPPPGPSASPSAPLPGSSAAGANSPGPNAADANAAGGAPGFGQSGPGERGRSSPQAPDDRPSSIVTMSLLSAETHRGAPFAVRGRISADGEPCGHVAVDIVLRSRAREVSVGQLATDERGAYDGTIVLPAAVPLGDYDVQARTVGDSRCGIGLSH